MAMVRNGAGEPRDIPLAGGVVEDGDTFEVDDDIFDSVHFSEGLFEVVEYPVKSKPAIKAAKVKE